MRTLAGAKRVRRVHYAASRQSGFTLFEILVVVALLAIFALVVLVVPTWQDDGQELDRYAARLQDSVALLNERSLFAGELAALQLEHDGWKPLRYDLVEQKFVPLEDQGLKAVSLPAALELVWELDVPEREDAVALSDVAERFVKDDALSEVGEALAGEEQPTDETSDSDDDEKPPFPQIFFFPSGETSPVLITIRSVQNLDAERRLRLSALGQVTNPDAQSREAAE